MAPYYTGGPGNLRFRNVGPVLEIWNDAANGVFFGEVTALFAYPGDPPLTDDLNSGYTRTQEFAVPAINLVMDWEYRAHVQECAKTAGSIDRLQTKAVFGKPGIDPGDPPPYRQYLRERVIIAAQIARAVNLQVFAHPHKEHIRHQPAAFLPGLRMPVQ